MADLKIGKTNVTELLRKAYKKLGAGWITLIEIPQDNHMEINTEALKILIGEMNYECIYLTLGKPFIELDKYFKSKGVNTSKLFYVDAISKMYSTEQPATKRVAYASGPVDTDGISVALRELLSSMNAERKCVFLDSVTTVLLYNSLPRTVRFNQFLTQMLKKRGVDGILVSIAKGTTTLKLIKELAKLCDEVISITVGGGVSIKTLN